MTQVISTQCNLQTLRLTSQAWAMWTILIACLIEISCTSGFTPFPSSRYVYSRQISTNSRGLRPSPLFSSLPSIRSDDDEEEEEETRPTFTTDAPALSLEKEGITFAALNGSDVRVGIIMSRWNADVVQALYKGVNESLLASGVKPTNIFSTYVPGAFELPLTARLLAASKRFDVIICLGCLIKGDTMHFEVIAQATANGIMQVGLESYVPIVFGVLTVYNKEQAVVRSTGEKNEGLGWGKTAVEMGLARMSAMGMGIKAKADDGSAFVTFASTPPKAANSSRKSFGF